MPKKLTYSPRWDLSTIPPELIRAECARLNGLLGGRKIQITTDKTLAEKRAAGRQRTRAYRDRQKASR
jgi:hypothetical protein